MKSASGHLRLNNLLALLTPLALIAPNIILDFTEGYMTAGARALNILWPLSIYTLTTSSFRKAYAGVLCLLPAMILAAFEIVLLFLYGDSVIAVDMFLNVVTTSVSEASELLAGLTTAMVTVCALYLPLTAGAIMAAARHSAPTGASLRRHMLRMSATASCVLTIVMIAYTSISDRFDITRDIFPVNAIVNACEATKRVDAVNRYAETSGGFSYKAHPTHPADEREIYLLVIGETSRAGNWQLCGYTRETNPRLSRRDNVIFYNKAISQSNTTHKSVPMLLSSINACNFDSIGCHKSIITAFKEAGFHTMFYSNQPPNRSYNQFFGEEADECVYLQNEDGSHPVDGEMAELLMHRINNSDYKKLFVVMHTYGSHFEYSDRYPRSYAHFTPDTPCNADASNRDCLINAYDNSIRYTDAFLDTLIGELEASGSRAALAYASDHGEDIYDDSRKRFLHASPTPTYHQLHTAMLIWTSQRMREADADGVLRLEERARTFVTPSESLFHTMLDIAGIATPYYNANMSLMSDSYLKPRPLYVTDHNKAVPLIESGIKSYDIILFDKLEIH